MTVFFVYKTVVSDLVDQIFYVDVAVANAAIDVPDISFASARASNVAFPIVANKYDYRVYYPV